MPGVNEPWFTLSCKWMVLGTAAGVWASDSHITLTTFLPTAFQPQFDARLKMDF